MKGFNFEKYFDVLKYNWIEDERGSADELYRVLGRNYEEFMKGVLPMEQAKQEYLKMQTERFQENFQFVDGFVHVNRNDENLVLLGEYDSPFTDENLERLIWAYLDERIMYDLSTILACEDRGLTEKKQQWEEEIKFFVSKGYDISPLMRCFNQRMKLYFKENPDIEGLGEMQDVQQGMTILQSIERESSPYYALFKMAEHLGNLELQYDELHNGDGADQEIDANVDAIDHAKAMIKAEISNFDLVMLESVLKNKRNLIKEEGGKYLENPLYKGINRVLMAVEKEKARQAQNEGMQQ